MAAARANPPADGVPYAFEKRMTVLLRARPGLDWREMWARALWRGAVACLALMLLLGALILAAPPTPSTSDLSQDLEITMFAAMNQDSGYLQ